VSIDLTLGIPRPRGPESLLSRLLSPVITQAQSVASARDSEVSGPPVVPASALIGDGGSDLGPIVVGLDIDPAELRSSSQARYEAVRYRLECPVSSLDEAIALRMPSPLVVYPVIDYPVDADTGITLADAAGVLANAGKIPGLSAGHPNAAVADFLAVLVHTDVGFVAQADTAEEVLAVLAGTVAALRGDDVRGALAEPDPGPLTTLIPEAAAAVREVLLGIEVPDVESMAAGLAAWGLR